MKSKSTAGMTAKQKTVVGVLLAIVVALLWGGVSLLFSAAEKPALAETKLTLTPVGTAFTIDTNEKSEQVVSFNAGNTGSDSVVQVSVDSSSWNTAKKYYLCIDVTANNSIVLGLQTSKDWSMVDNYTTTLTGDMSKSWEITSAVNSGSATSFSFFLNTYSDPGSGTDTRTITFHDISVKSEDELAPGELTIGAMTCENSAYTIDSSSADNYAVVSYSTDPGWNKCFIDISNIGEKNWLYMTFTPTDDFEIALGIGNDATIQSFMTVDAGEKGTIKKDISSLALGDSFTMSIWFDANVSKDSNTVTFHTVGLYTESELPKEEPSELKIGDMRSATEAFTVTKTGTDQTVSFSAAPGYNIVTAQVSGYTSDMKFLCLNFTLNDNMTICVLADDTYLRAHDTVVKNATNLVLPLSDKNLPSSFTLKFYLNAVSNPGAEYSTDNPKTIVFHSISFSETDPTASSEPNHFREPTGVAGVVYSSADKKITYTNSAAETWRYLDILLENHDVAYDVLALNITGYNGLVLGVRVIYNDEVEGSETSATLDVIPSSAYYSKIETDDAVELVIYLEAYGLKGREVTGVQLYLDAPAGAGKVGDVELTLNSIEMLKSGEGAFDPADTALTASDATVTYGTAPDFNAALTSGGTAIEGRIITEYRSSGATGNYEAGLPEDAGEYEVRFYYMGSREYKYNRATTATLTINKAAAATDTADDGVTFDTATRTVTVKTGYEASDSATFETGHEIADGYVLAYGTTKTVYFRVAADKNHLASTTVKSKEFTAPEAPASALASIAVTAQPTKTTYTVGDKLDLTGLVVTATYTDESTAPVAVTAAMLSDYDMSKAGTYHVKVTYEGKTATFDITVNAATATKTLSSIAVTTKPAKTTYTVGDKLDLTGLVVTATYTDESTAPVTVTAAMLSDYDMTKAGTYHVKVTYEGKTATFDVTVNAAQASGGSDEGLTGGEIAIIVIAVIVCVGAAAAAIAIVLVKKKKNNQPKD